MTSEVIDAVKRLTHLEVRPPNRRLVVRASKGVAVTPRPMTTTMTTEMDLVIDQEIATWKYTEEEGGTKQGLTAGVRSPVWKLIQLERLSLAYCDFLGHNVDEGVLD